MSRTVSSLPCGAKVRFGSYCVGNEGAHSIRWIKVNSADTTLLAEHIEDFRAFDARELDSPQEYRREYGNNRYSVSNIDQFLNSAGDEWYHPQHDTDAPPTGELTYDGTPYLNHPGFLAYFSEAEIEAIMPTDIVVALPRCDSDDRDYEIITRKVFLPSRTNIFGSSVRNTNEGDRWDYFRNGRNASATATEEAIDNTTLNGAPDDEITSWYWWLRSPNADSACYARCVGRGGSGGSASACRGIFGVRPALTINPEILVSDEPDDEGYYNVILSIVELEDVSEEDFLSILLG